MQIEDEIMFEMMLVENFRLCYTKRKNIMEYDLTMNDKIIIKGADGKDGEKGEQGEKGTDGKTPVKGTDYYTEVDKQEMINSVIEALPKYNGGVS